jgi:hypothetical protein
MRDLARWIVRERVVIMKSTRPVVALTVACLLLPGCSNAGSDDDETGDGPAATTVPATDDDVTGDGPADTTDDASGVGLIAETGHAGAVAALTGLLPADTRGVFVFDIASLLSGGSSADLSALLNGEGADPALNELFGAVGALAGSIDVPGTMTSALLGQTTDAADGLFLLAGLGSETIEEVVAGPMPTPDGEYGSASRVVYLDGQGNHLMLLPGGVLVVGTRSAVESVVDVADGANPGNASAIVPFLGALVEEADLSFAYGLPALFDDDATPDRSLRSAAVMSGALDVVDGGIAGEMAFHTSNASEFVEAYNALNQPSTLGDDPLELPLTLADPLADGLSRVVLTIPLSPLEPSFDEVVASRNIFKKLFAGM